MTAAQAGTRTAATAMAPRLKLGAAGIAENIAWVVIIGHVVRWAVDALYFLVIQLQVGFDYPAGHRVWDYGPKDLWDRLPVHIRNMLHEHWFAGQSAPAWWVFDRHAARDLVIGIITGVVVFFLFAKPRTERRVYSWHRLAATPLLALLYAVPGVAVGGVIIWRVTWMRQHGWAVPGSGVLANEANGFIAAGHWEIILLCILGSWLCARHASLGPADEVQWYLAEREAARRASTGVTGAVARRLPLIGPPGFRLRVRWLMTSSGGQAPRGKAVERVLSVFAAGTFLLAGFGAWLTLAGPAAGVH